VGLGRMFSQVVGTSFQLMSAFEYLWKDIFESSPSVIYGFGLGQKENFIEVIIHHETLHDSFIEGIDSYSDIWRRVLASENWKAVEKLKKLRSDNFYCDSQLWARIVFDFAIAFNIQKIERDNLLQALIPLYHSRTLSFANTTSEMETRETEAIEEKLNRNFEAEKSYLIKHWDLASKNSDVSTELSNLHVND